MQAVETPGYQSANSIFDYPKIPWVSKSKFSKRNGGRSKSRTL